MLTNVIVLKVFEQRDFSDGGAWSSFLVLQSDFFQSYQIVGETRLALENCCISALKKRHALKTRLGTPKPLI